MKDIFIGAGIPELQLVHLCQFVEIWSPEWLSVQVSMMALEETALFEHCLVEGHSLFIFERPIKMMQGRILSNKF